MSSFLFFSITVPFRWRMPPPGPNGVKCPLVLLSFLLGAKTSKYPFPHPQWSDIYVLFGPPPPPLFFLPGPFFSPTPLFRLRRFLSNQALFLVKSISSSPTSGNPVYSFFRPFPAFGKLPPCHNPFFSCDPEGLSEALVFSPFSPKFSSKLLSLFLFFSLVIYRPSPQAGPGEATDFFFFSSFRCYDRSLRPRSCFHFLSAKGVPVNCGF